MSLRDFLANFSPVSVIGIIAMTLGFMVALYTCTLFKDSKKVRNKQAEERDKSKDLDTYLKLNEFITVVWKCIFITGLIIFLFGLII
ncbi:hypothetical protein FACS189475_07950 [Betaproteobacteria bacterium]|nr:hypothetical protein FACS189475_07950 [Betaproteobacteria bacterium]